MTVINNDVFNAVKQNSKLNPTSRNCDFSFWLKKLENFDKLSERDQNIVHAAIFYGKEIQHIRSTLDSIALNGIGKQFSVQLATAVLNNIMSFVEDSRKILQKKAVKNNIYHLNSISKMPLPDHTQEISSDDMNDIAIDSAEWWLQRSMMLENTPDNFNLSNIKNIAKIAAAKFSIERSLTDLWEQVFWQNWYVKQNADHFIQLPENPIEEELRVVWALRHENKFLQEASRINLYWSIMRKEEKLESRIRGVIEIKKQRNKKTEYIIGNKPVNMHSPDINYLHMVCLENSYLSNFLDKNLPDIGITLRQCAMAWGILNDICTLTKRSLPKEPFANKNNVYAWAMPFHKDEIIQVISKSLNIDIKLSTKIIDFFTWKPRIDKGLWAAPLVPIPGTDKICLVRSIVLVSNMMRWAEIVMRKGGYSDNIKTGLKGLPFEEDVRKKISSAIDNNEIFRTAKCIPMGMKKEKNNEEIDIFIFISDTLFIGEIKCWLYPSEARECYNRNRAIDEAVEQILRKTEWAKENQKTIARHCDVSVEYINSLKIKPLIIQNQSYGVGKHYPDCVICDADFLALYLEGGFAITGEAVNREGLVAREGIKFYDTEQQAANLLFSIFKNNPILNKLRSKMKWSSTIFPISNGKLLISRFGLDFESEDQSLLYTHLRSHHKK